MEELLGISISTSTVQRRSHEIGQRIKQQRDWRIEQMTLLRLPPSPVFPSRLHTSADGVMIHIGGGWKEVKTASVFETDANGEAIRIAYCASTAQSHIFGRHWRLLAHLAGMDHCRDLAVVADGAPGSGVEESCNKNVVQVRMKRAGMRWGEERSESILQLCAWYHSHNRPGIAQYLA
jgi:hypothetical protein